jgi:hypothetical protein
MIRFQNGYECNEQVPARLALSVLHTTEKKYGALISAARKDWERRFAGRDPADACVTVRISAGEPQQERSRMFPLQAHAQRRPFATN